MFFEALSDNLNTHDQMKHFIKLMKKKLSRIDLIYKMSQNEFATIRDYLISALKKKWIRSLSNLIKAFVLFMKKSDKILRLCVNYRELNEIIIKNKYSLSLLFKTLKRFIHARYFIKINI